jgi:hypothetical protein
LNCFSKLHGAGDPVLSCQRHWAAPSCESNSSPAFVGLFSHFTMVVPLAPLRSSTHWMVACYRLCNRWVEPWGGFSRAEVCPSVQDASGVEVLRLRISDVERLLKTCTPVAFLLLCIRLMKARQHHCSTFPLCSTKPISAINGFLSLQL